MPCSKYSILQSYSLVSCLFIHFVSLLSKRLKGNSVKSDLFTKLSLMFPLLSSVHQFIIQTSFRNNNVIRDAIEYPLVMYSISSMLHFKTFNQWTLGCFRNCQCTCQLEVINLPGQRYIIINYEQPTGQLTCWIVRYTCKPVSLG